HFRIKVLKHVFMKNRRIAPGIVAQKSAAAQVLSGINEKILQIAVGLPEYELLFMVIIHILHSRFAKSIPIIYMTKVPIS
ncbi:MAG: hypothetical protein Q8924_20435, partial [Bacillota bacterium]|nr:hypothetical protein [Bacillota bacterium]